jgi:hypothetical protein
MPRASASTKMRAVMAAALSEYPSFRSTSTVYAVSRSYAIMPCSMVPLS